MSYDLTGQKISFTYGRVVQVVSGSYYDGFGNLLPIGTSSISASLSGFATTGSNIFIGDQIITGSVFVTNTITGSLNGTASYSNNSLNSETASYYNGSVISSSYALTASYAENSTSSSYSSTSTSASYAITASYALFAETANNAQNAQDILVYVKNTSGEIITKGHLVRIVGVDNSSANPTIELADYRTENISANTLGYTYQDFGINSFGYVITEGRLTGVNTGNFTSGDLLYLSSSGDYTNVQPIAPNHTVRIGQVIRAQQNNGSIYVTIDNGSELGEAHNVVDNTTTGSFGDLLIKSGSVWINSRSLTGSYIISGSLTTNDGFNSISITASNISSSNITGSLYGTSSWAINSLTASYVSSNNVNGTVTSASYALSSSYSNNTQLLNNTSSNIFATTGSNTFTSNQTVSNGFVILSQVSASLNFTDDVAAASGGVPLGGLYRNGNFILIRLS